MERAEASRALLESKYAAKRAAMEGAAARRRSLEEKLADTSLSGAQREALVEEHRRAEHTPARARDDCASCGASVFSRTRKRASIQAHNAD